MSRPAINTLACLGCRTAILRAVLCRNLAVHSPAAPLPPRRFFSQGRGNWALQRQFATEDVPGDDVVDDDNADQKPGQNADQNTAENEDQMTARNADQNTAENTNQKPADKPWFLNVEPPRHLPGLHEQSIPKAPQGAPSMLDPMIQYIYKDMGLDNLALFDMRGMDPPASLGPNLIMLFGTARSERHLHISSSRFVRWLWRNHKVKASADGLIGPGELKTKLRRMRKKAKLLGTNPMIVPGVENGLTSGWVCVNFVTNRDIDSQRTNFDERGRMSGFGAAPMGTTVVIQCLTEARRDELDLEGLWQGLLGRNFERQLKIEGKDCDYEADVTPLVLSRIQLPPEPSRPSAATIASFDSEPSPTSGSSLASESSVASRSPLVPASPLAPAPNSRPTLLLPPTSSVGSKSSLPSSHARPKSFESIIKQQRRFSTLARRLQGKKPNIDNADERVSKAETAVHDVAESAEDVGTDAVEGAVAEASGPSLNSLGQQIQQLQLCGTSFSQDVFEGLLAAVFSAEDSSQDTVSKRLDLFDQLLQTGEERGLRIFSIDILVKTIGMVAQCSAYGPELERVQKNLELLLTQTATSALREDQLVSLMVTYLGRKDWDGFWDTFRSPTRFKQGRSPALYTLAFGAMALSRDPRLCTDALRWVWPEMLKESPRVPFGAQLHDALRACVMIADPEARHIFENPPNTYRMPPVEDRKIQRREFVRVLREADALRRHWDQEALRMKYQSENCIVFTVDSD